MNDGDWGNNVRISHGNGYYTVYCHLASVTVANDTDVTIGTQVGVIGTTGNSTGTHLHFSLHSGSASGSITNSVLANQIWARDVSVNGSFRWFTSEEFVGDLSSGHVYEAGDLPTNPTIELRNLPPSHWYSTNVTLDWAKTGGPATTFVREYAGSNVIGGPYGSASGYINIAAGGLGWKDYKATINLSDTDANASPRGESAPWSGGFDDQPPGASQVGGSPTQTWIHDGSVTYLGTDALSGFRDSEWYFEGGASEGVSVANPRTVNLPNTTGIWKLYAKVQDNAYATPANTEGNRATVLIGEYWIDQIAPTANSAVPTYASPGTGGTIPITVSGSDANSGIGTLTLFVDGTNVGSTSESPGTIDWNATTFGEGVHTLVVRATDRAGNASDSAPISYRIDRTPPVSSLTLSGSKGLNDWYAGAVTFTLNSTDASGVGVIYYSLNGAAYVRYSQPVKLTTGGATQIRYFATDVANPSPGNAETPRTATVKIDATVPNPVLITTDISPVPEGRWIQFQWDASDPESQLSMLLFAVTDNPNAVNGDLTWSQRALPDPATTTGVIRIPTDMNPGTRYYVRVRARNGAGAWSNTFQSSSIFYQYDANAISTSEFVLGSVAGTANGSGTYIRSSIGAPAVTGAGRNVDGQPGQAIGSSLGANRIWAGLFEGTRTIGHAPDLLFQSGSNGRLGGLYKTETAFNWRVLTASTSTGFAAGIIDIDNDGRSDALLQDIAGTQVSSMRFTGQSSMEVSPVVDLGSSKRARAGGDFDRDGKADLLVEDQSAGTLLVYRAAGGINLIGSLPAGWYVVGTGDFDKDGDSDVALQGGAGGKVVIWMLEGFRRSQNVTLPSPEKNDVAGAIADIDGDGWADIVYRRGASDISAMLLTGSTFREWRAVGSVPAEYRLVGGR